MDADGIVQLRAVAGGLARVVADAAHHRRAAGCPSPARARPSHSRRTRRGRATAGCSRRPGSRDCTAAAVHIHGPLLPPGARLVGKARTDIERDRKRLIHRCSPAPCSPQRSPRPGRPPSRPKRRMLRSAPAWMRAITSLRSSGSNRCAKRFCGRRYSSHGHLPANLRDTAQLAVAGLEHREDAATPSPNGRS